MGLAAQPDTVRTFLSASKNLARGTGFAARFLIAWPASTQGQRLFRAAGTWAGVGAYGKRLRALLAIRPNTTDTGALAPPALRFTPPAQAAWIAFHDDVERELRVGGEMTDVRDVASKAADQAARLAALFHVFEYGPVGEIGEAGITAAASIVGWHLFEARRFLGDVSTPREMSDARKLDAWLTHRCRRDGVTTMALRDIQQTGPNVTRKRQALDAALAELADAGRVRLIDGGKRLEVRLELLGDNHGVA